MSAHLVDERLHAHCAGREQSPERKGNVVRPHARQVTIVRCRELRADCRRAEQCDVVRRVAQEPDDVERDKVRAAGVRPARSADRPHTGARSTSMRKHDLRRERGCPRQRVRPAQQRRHDLARVHGRDQLRVDIEAAEAETRSAGVCSAAAGARAITLRARVQVARSRWSRFAFWTSGSVQALVGRAARSAGRLQRFKSARLPNIDDSRLAQRAPDSARSFLVCLSLPCDTAHVEVARAGADRPRPRSRLSIPAFCCFPIWILLFLVARSASRIGVSRTAEKSAAHVARIA